MRGEEEKVKEIGVRAARGGGRARGEGRGGTSEGGGNSAPTPSSCTCCGGGAADGRLAGRPGGGEKGREEGWVTGTSSPEAVQPRHRHPRAAEQRVRGGHL